MTNDYAEHTDGALKRGFGWRHMGRCTVTKEDSRMIKAIMRELSEIKTYCRYFENKRGSIFKMAGITPGEITFLDMEKVKELLALPMAEDDKKGLYAYFDARTKIMLMAIGMERLPKGQYRKIAQDRYYMRLSYREIMDKYGVSHDTVRRAMARTNQCLAEYVRWYNELAGRAKQEIGL